MMSPWSRLRVFLTPLVVACAHHGATPPPAAPPATPVAIDPSLRPTDVVLPDPPLANTRVSLRSLAHGPAGALAWTARGDDGAWRVWVGEADHPRRVTAPPTGDDELVLVEGAWPPVVQVRNRLLRLDGDAWTELGATIDDPHSNDAITVGDGARLLIASIASRPLPTGTVMYERRILAAREAGGQRSALPEGPAWRVGGVSETETLVGAVARDDVAVAVAQRNRTLGGVGEVVVYTYQRGAWRSHAEAGLAAFVGDAPQLALGFAEGAPVVACVEDAGGGATLALRRWNARRRRWSELAPPRAVSREADRTTTPTLRGDGRAVAWLDSGAEGLRVRVMRVEAGRWAEVAPAEPVDDTPVVIAWDGDDALFAAPTASGDVTLGRAHGGRWTRATVTARGP